MASDLKTRKSFATRKERFITYSYLIIQNNLVILLAHSLGFEVTYKPKVHLLR